MDLSEATDKTGKIASLWSMVSQLSENSTLRKVLWRPPAEGKHHPDQVLRQISTSDGQYLLFVGNDQFPADAYQARPVSAVVKAVHISKARKSKVLSLRFPSLSFL
jgi:hypothetical protein